MDSIAQTITYVTLQATTVLANQNTNSDPALRELLGRLPEISDPTNHSGIIDGFLVGLDKDVVQLVSGHLRLTFATTQVLEVEYLDESINEPRARAVRLRVQLPCVISEITQSLPEEIVDPSHRPFSIATRQYCLNHHASAHYQEKVAAFLLERRIKPSEPSEA